MEEKEIQNILDKEVFKETKKCKSKRKHYENWAQYYQKVIDKNVKDMEEKINFKTEEDNRNLDEMLDFLKNNDVELIK